MFQTWKKAREAPWNVSAEPSRDHKAHIIWCRDWLTLMCTHKHTHACAHHRNMKSQTSLVCHVFLQGSEGVFPSMQLFVFGSSRHICFSPVKLEVLTYTQSVAWSFFCQLIVIQHFLNSENVCTFVLTSVYVTALLNLGDITNSCPGVDKREECKIKDVKLFALLVSLTLPGEWRPIKLDRRGGGFKLSLHLAVNLHVLLDDITCCFSPGVVTLSQALLLQKHVTAHWRLPCYCVYIYSLTAIHSWNGLARTDVVYQFSYSTGFPSF